MRTPTHPTGYRPDPDRDLLLERDVGLPPELDTDDDRGNPWHEAGSARPTAR